MKRPYVLIFLILLFSASLTALDPKTALEKYICHNWTTRHGLPQNTVRCIVQDNKGFIWLGTDLGLVRFDGSHFISFDSTNTPEITNNSIRSLLPGADGSLVIGTFGGGISIYKDGKFSNGDFDAPNAPKLVNDMVRDDSGALWIATTGSGVVRASGNNFKALSTKTGLSSNIASSLLIDSANHLWVGTENGLNRLSQRNVSVLREQQGLTGNKITALLQDRSGSLWVGTSHGLNRLDARIGEDPNSFSVLNRFQKKDGLAGDYIYGVKEDKDGNIWVAANGGLSRLDTRNLRRHGKVKIDNFNDGSFSDNQMRTLLEDKQGNLWVGTASGGLNVLREGKFEFLTEDDGLADSYIKTVFQDRGGGMWIGTSGSGLNHKINDRMTTYNRSDGLSSNFIETIAQDNAGNLWVGTANGLNRLTDGKFTIYSKGDGLASTDIRTLFNDSKGNLWVGTFGGGLYLQKDGKFLRFSTKQGLSDDFVISLGEDGYGNLWVGTNRGVNCYDGTGFRRFNGKPGVPEGMITDIYCDADGTLWLATDSEGLVRYKAGVFHRFSNGWDFTGKAIFRILEDNQDNLWFSTGNGIYSVSRRRLNKLADNASGPFISPRNSTADTDVETRFFQEDDGMKSSVCTGGSQPAGWKTTEGKIWFPTIKGIAVMNLSRTMFRMDEFPLFKEPVVSEQIGMSYVTVIREQPVIIEKITVAGKSIPLQTHLTLPKGADNVRFYFVALNFRTPGKTLYRYRLLGFENTWRLSRENSAAYNDLPPGEYQFKVYARNSDGRWSYEGDSYYFTVTYSFFTSFFFYVLLMILLSVALIKLPPFLERRRNSESLEDMRYKRSHLTPQRSRKHLDNLLLVMKEKKPYLDPEMSLLELAKLVGITKEDLSQVVNEQLGKNFKHFLNEYRIEEAKQRLLDPKENQFVLLKIAFDVGFNSKSAFNASFKKITGVSPSQFRKNNQEEFQE